MLRCAKVEFENQYGNAKQYSYLTDNDDIKVGDYCVGS